MLIKFGKKKIEMPVRKVSELGKFSGLMFKKRETDNLFFEFKQSKFPSIHSFFVFFEFLAVWLDENHSVVDFQVVKPFTFNVSPKFPSKKLIEVPLNEKNKKIFNFFVGKRKV